VSIPFVPATVTYSIFRSCCRIATSVLFDLKVYGAEHVPVTGGALLLSNHLSYLDPPCIGVQLRRPTSYLAKSELFEVPVFGRVIPKLNAFPVRQGAGDIGAVRETIRRLQEGHVLTVFPEGSRSADGELQPLAGGFTLIVRKVDVPIIPVAIDGTFQAWPIHQSMFKPTPVRVKFGPPMNVQKMKAPEIIAKVEGALKGLIADLRAMRKAEDGETITELN
jgi:1-acyl-sn-glycerol-3-phosphate acyltransferase